MTHKSEIDDLGRHGDFFLNGLFDPHGSKTQKHIVETAYYVNVLKMPLETVLVVKAFIRGHHTKAIGNYLVEEALRLVAVEEAKRRIDESDFADKEWEIDRTTWFSNSASEI